jgi:hypothetical protein
MPTMDALPTMPLCNQKLNLVKQYPFAESMHTFKMESLRSASVTSPSKLACKQLLHAMARWPEAIEIKLWPYAMCNAINICNTTADKEDGSSPLEQFCDTKQCPSKTLTQSHLQLSSVCTTRSAAGRIGNTKMEQMGQTQNQPWSIAMTCKLSQPSVEIRHRVSLATVSRPV